MSQGEPVVASRRERGDTPRSLVRAAETEFAARGIDAVSLRELSRLAGQRNNTALQYHFDGRDGLLRAIVAKHNVAVSQRRHALLDHLETTGDYTLRDLSSAFVMPLAAKLTDVDGGPEFLQIAAQLANRVQRTIQLDEPAAGLAYDEQRSIERLALLLEPYLPPGTVGAPLHRRFAAMRFVYIELGRRAARTDATDHRLFTCHLIDLMAALLQAPLSSATRQFLVE
ncbi:Transcriptional regulator, TetR family [Mycobacterium sp. THAF192]|nr:Transcriptional regulator, TetR family [Mycobacterium sp. THAF192]